MFICSTHLCYHCWKLDFSNWLLFIQMGGSNPFPPWNIQHWNCEYCVTGINMDKLIAANRLGILATEAPIDFVVRRWMSLCCTPALLIRRTVVPWKRSHQGDFLLFLPSENSDGSIILVSLFNGVRSSRWPQVKATKNHPGRPQLSWHCRRICAVWTRWWKAGMLMVSGKSVSTAEIQSFWMQMFTWKPHHFRDFHAAICQAHLLRSNESKKTGARYLRWPTGSRRCLDLQDVNTMNWAFQQHQVCQQSTDGDSGMDDFWMRNL